MNATLKTQSIVPNNSRNRQNLQPIAPPRRAHLERDFGIGYGNSSGYVSHRRYSSNWGASRFSCA